MKALLLMLLAFVAAPARADGIPFTAGLPNFPPLRNAAIHQPHTATLPSTSDGTFQVVTGEKADGTAVWWLLHKHTNGTGLQALMMQPDANGTSTATVKLDLGSVIRTLQLTVPPARDVLRYRWLDDIQKKVARGQPLPPFDVVARDGKRVALDELQGSIVVLNSWATWCVPCVEELPVLNALVTKYANRGVQFVAIMEPKQSGDLTAFLKEHPFAYRQTLATDSSRGIFGDAYPRHVILGADGKVAFDSTGGSAHVDRELSAVLDQLLKK